MPKRDNIVFLEIEYEVGDYVQVKENNVKAVIIYKKETSYKSGPRKYKYTIVDNDYNKRTYYADQLIKLKKTKDTYVNNVFKFNKK